MAPNFLFAKNRLLLISVSIKFLQNSYGSVRFFRKNNQTICFIKLLLFLLFLSPNLGYCQKVVFINPGGSSEIYWSSASRMMQMAADSLNMQLEILYTERDHLKSIQIADQLIDRPKISRPDYVVFSNDYGLSQVLLQKFNDAKIPCFMAFSAPTPEERLRVGSPRQKYKYWIGSLEPFAEDAGYLTASELIKKARNTGYLSSDNKLRMIAIAGDRSTNSSILRTKGLYRAVEESTDVVLEQVVYADWSEAKAEIQATWLFQRYPKAKLLWAGNDVMAFGAMTALEKLGGRPGKTNLFSAINTSDKALNELSNGRLSTLAGGHFIIGAWAMVMIHDYAHGIDFKDEELEFVRPMFILFTPHRAKRFLKIFDQNAKPIDFKNYSKFYNSKIKNYVFEFNKLIN